MFGPNLPAGIEERRRFVGIRIDAFSVRPFMAVAMRTNQGQILHYGLATRVARDDMIDRKPRHLSRHRQVAVFAPPRRTGLNDRPLLLTDDTHAAPATSGNNSASRSSARRASSLSMVRCCVNLTRAISSAC